MEMSQSTTKPNGFCWVPFVEQYIRSDGKFSLCCDALGVTITDKSGRNFFAGTDAMDKVWQSEAMQKIRAKFLAGKPPKACEACFAVERAGVKSRRLFVEEEFESTHQKLGTRFDQQLASTFLKQGESSPPEILDIRLGNHCNLSCRMCNSRQSSRFHQEVGNWIKDQRNLTKNLTQDYEVVEQDFDDTWISADQFWEQIHHQAPKLKRINFAGGEPLFNRSLIQFLEERQKRGDSPQLGVKFITNLSYLGESLLNTLAAARFPAALTPMVPSMSTYGTLPAGPQSTQTSNEYYEDLQKILVVV